MIRALIIDDERDARFLLRNILDEKFANDVAVVGEADDVESGVKVIEKHHPDLVFLDIKMPQGTGFDLLEKVKRIDFEVIFVTAFDSYAIKAFQFSAFGYLMKPLRENELKKLVGKLKDNQILLERKSEAEKRVKILMENYGDGKKIRKMVLSNMEGFKVVEIENVIRLEGDGKYTNFIITGAKKIISSKNLGEYEELLADYGFFRIHQSTIVNLRHVSGYQKSGGGQVEMSDGETFKLSRHRRAEFMERFL